MAEAEKALHIDTDLESVLRQRISDLETRLTQQEEELAHLRQHMQTPLGADERFVASVENMLDCFGIYTAVRDDEGHIVDFRVEYVNAAACESNHMTRAEQIGRGLLEILPAHKSLGLFDLYCQLVESGQPLVKQQLVYADSYKGKRLERAFDIRAAKLGDGFVATWRDVTAQKELELALSENERILRVALDAGQMGMWVWDCAERAVWNRQMCVLFGIETGDGDRYEVDVSQAYQRMHPDDYQLNQRIVEDVMARGKDFRQEFRVILPDKGVHWLVSVGRLFRDDQGSPTQMIGVTYNITERRQTEDALRNSEAHLRMILENSRDGIHQVDLLTNYYVFMSPSQEDLTGFSMEDLMMSMDEAAARLHPDDRAHVDAYLARVIAGEDPDRPMEYRWRVRSGEYRWFSDSRRAIRSEEGKAISLIGVSRDITTRKQAEEALQALTESLEARVQERTQQVRDLASRIALAEHEERKRIAQILHDHVQQILYGLQMRSHMLQEDLSQRNPKFADSHLSSMQALIEDAIQAIRTLTVELSPPVLEQEGLVEALQWLADHMQRVHGLSIQVEAKGSCGITDKNLRMLLFQILRELLFNVVKHADVDHAAVRLYRQNNECVAIVSDQGKGFGPDSQSSQDNVTYGFGLTNVSERLKLFGGRLEIQSSPGDGTQITVALPFSDPETQ